MKPPPWHDLQQQLMRACGENPGIFKRRPEDEAEHQRQQAAAEARAERWARAQDEQIGFAGARGLEENEEKHEMPLDVGNDMQAELFPLSQASAT